jgi:tRNA(Ile2) C34 agmatinyltransferase TiaS
MGGMKWQNLAEKRCPACGDPLKSEGGNKYRVFYCDCCEFSITSRKYYEILVDETHNMRKFLTHDKIDLIESAKKMLAETI